MHELHHKDQRQYPNANKLGAFVVWGRFLRGITFDRLDLVQMEGQHDAGIDLESKATLSHGGIEQNPTQVATSEQQATRSAILNSLSWVILCSSMLLAEVQAAIDSTMTADLQPTIIHAFGEISNFRWINVSYSLGLSG